MFDLNYIKNMLDDIYIITTPYIVEYTNKNYIVSICNYFNIKIYSCCKTSKEFYNTALIPV
jgi:hypothetical protein